MLLNYERKKCVYFEQLVRGKKASTINHEKQTGANSTQRCNAQPPLGAHGRVESLCKLSRAEEEVRVALLTSVGLFTDVAGFAHSVWISCFFLHRYHLTYFSGRLSL